MVESDDADENDESEARRAATRRRGLRTVCASGGVGGVEMTSTSQAVSMSVPSGAVVAEAVTVEWEWW
jgi:hypothetical protein